MVCDEIFIQQSCETVDTVHKLDFLKLEIYLIRTEFEPRVEREARKRLEQTSLGDNFNENHPILWKEKDQEK